MENRIKLFALFIRDVWRVNGKKEGKLKATKGGEEKRNRKSEIRRKFVSRELDTILATRK